MKLLNRVLLAGLATAAAFGQSFTSHDKLALTYFFYWYDAVNNWHYNVSPTEHVTLHPPDSYLSTFTYQNPVFFQNELSDMAAAGIDVALAVFWADPPNTPLVWTVPGLKNMVVAEQAMAQAGQSAPKIGMFFDTTSLPPANGGVKPDLTTAAGRAQFYGVIHTFFSIVPKQFQAMIDGKPIIVLYGSGFVSAYDQSTFDYINQQFQQDFGTTPYIVRHPSWLNVTTDAAYAGWPTAYSATFAGDVASVLPGHDNYGVIQMETKPIVIDRNCGDLYQQEWDQVVAHGARLVFIEDWNELFEGTGISATKEYGRRYVDQTARNVTLWKSTPTPPAAPSPSMVWASLGAQLYHSGLYPPLNNGGAAWLPTRIAGHDAVYPDHTWPSYYIYLAADDTFLATRPAAVWITVEYLDSTATPWRLEYDGVPSPFTATALAATPQSSGQWKLQTFRLPDALFQKRETPNTDFRIDDSSAPLDQTHYFNRVWVTKTAPIGQPPNMPVLSDVAVPAGASLDVPIAVADSSGKPLLVSLATAPAFVTLQGAAGAQNIHIAPSPADIRSCSDVTGPGITSTPSYRIALTANDPNSTLSSGATTFSVLVTAPPPVIQLISDAWDYGPGLAPGAWVTIWGSALAAGAPEAWNLTGSQLPTALDNVSVTFNGLPAVLSYVSSTLIDALAPAAIQAGPVQVVVTANGVSSAPFTVAATPTLPAVYALPEAGGSRLFITAALAGTGTLIGNPATDPRVARAAQPGDMLDLYMIGLGATQDPAQFITDSLFSAAAPVAAPIAVTIGGTPADVLFAGLISPGLYLVRIAVPPSVGAGAQPLQVSAGTAKSPASLFLMVGPM
jgi:uncharacterized protein (TIGR03437 family)